jgi:hypothetical protein
VYRPRSHSQMSASFCEYVYPGDFFCIQPHLDLISTTFLRCHMVSPTAPIVQLLLTSASASTIDRSYRTAIPRVILLVSLLLSHQSSWDSLNPSPPLLVLNFPASASASLLTIFPSLLIAALHRLFSQHFRCRHKPINNLAPMFMYTCHSPIRTGTLTLHPHSRPNLAYPAPDPPSSSSNSPDPPYLPSIVRVVLVGARAGAAFARVRC